MSPIKREFILYLEDMLKSMDRIDYELIWEIARKNLPQNRNDLIEIIRKEKAQGGNNG